MYLIWLIFQIAIKLSFLSSITAPPPPTLFFDLLSFQLSKQTRMEMLATQANFALTHGNEIFF